MKKFASHLLTLCLLNLFWGAAHAQKPGQDSKPVGHETGQMRAVDQVLRAAGGFIQLDDPEMKFAAWPTLLKELTGRAGMDTFIIQRLFFRYRGPARSHILLREGKIDINDPRYNSSMRLADNDPTNAILSYADQSYANADTSDDVKVYVGLWMDEMRWENVVSETPEQLKNYLDGVADKMIKVADLAWNLYHRHPSFRGWYVSHEFWNFPYGDGSAASSRKRALFGEFLGKVVAACKALNKKGDAQGGPVERPVAVSAYFNPWLYLPYAGPDQTEALYTSILTGSGLDVLMVQDSVGTRCLGDERLDSPALERRRAEEIRPLVPRFMKAYANAARAASNDGRRIALWDDVEAFEVVSGTGGCRGEQPYNENAQLRPTSIGRLKWQFGVAAFDPKTSRPSHLFEKYVVFDLFHYMNTVVPEGFGTSAGNTQQLRTKLFEDYLRDFVARPFDPQTGLEYFPDTPKSRE